jgi:hypothetical protein
MPPGKFGGIIFQNIIERWSSTESALFFKIQRSGLCERERERERNPVMMALDERRPLTGIFSSALNCRMPSLLVEDKQKKVA